MVPSFSTWNKLPLGWTKVNWDAALDKETKKMGDSVVARDGSGHFLAASAIVIPHITDPATTKELVAWWAVLLYWNLGFTQVVLEGDS
jgi:hypothetical protein